MAPHIARDDIRAVLIFGPTASGKSALAAALARRLDGVVVNADALQLYRGLPVLTAQPEPALRAMAPHRLYEVLAWQERASAGWWQRALQPVLEEGWQRRQIPILVGGTGLYLRTALTGLAPTPPVGPDLLAALARRLEEEGAEKLHGELAAVDPVLAARIAPRDRQRILRGLAVFRATGRPLSAWQSEAGKTAPLKAAAAAGRVAGFVLWPERTTLYRRIDERFVAMMAAGALEEVRALAAADLDPDLPVMKAVGVRPLLQHLAGELDRAAAVAIAQRDSRRYAKRQLTWARHQFRGWTRVPVALQHDETEALAGHLERMLGEAGAAVARWLAGRTGEGTGDEDLSRR